jgi:hypothetical protein
MREITGVNFDVARWSTPLCSYWHAMTSSSSFATQ